MSEGLRSMISSAGQPGISPRCGQTRSRSRSAISPLPGLLPDSGGGAPPRRPLRRRHAAAFSGLSLRLVQPASAAWRAIDSTAGVSRLVNFGEHVPSRVPQHLVTGLDGGPRQDCPPLAAACPESGRQRAFAQRPVRSIRGDGGEPRAAAAVWVLLDRGFWFVSRRRRAEGGPIGTRSATGSLMPWRGGHAER